MLKNLNAVMSIIANVPAAVASTVSNHIMGMYLVTDVVLDRCLSRCPTPHELHHRGSRGLWVRSSIVHRDRPANVHVGLRMHPRLRSGAPDSHNAMLTL